MRGLPTFGSLFSFHLLLQALHQAHLQLMRVCYLHPIRDSPDFTKNWISLSIDVTLFLGEKFVFSGPEVIDLEIYKWYSVLQQTLFCSHNLLKVIHCCEHLKIRRFHKKISISKFLFITRRADLTATMSCSPIVYRVG